MLAVRRSHGFSLIELMMAIAIMSLLLFLGVPAFSTYIQNTKLRSAADNFYAGLQMARAEAVRRNAQVQLLLTDVAPIEGNRNTGNLTATGSNWMLRTPDPDNPGAFLFIEGKSMKEGSSAQAVQIDGAVSSVTFNGFGATTLAAAATFAFTNPRGGDCAAASGPMRCLNVVVSIGGQSRMCDPAVSAADKAAGDTRAC